MAQASFQSPSGSVRSKLVRSQVSVAQGEHGIARLGDEGTCPPPAPASGPSVKHLLYKIVKQMLDKFVKLKLHSGPFTRRTAKMGL